MAKNSDVYKTAQERAEAFGKFCDGEQCYRCKLISYHSSNKNMCRFAWLDLECEGDEPLPCILCKSKMQHIKEGSGHFLACVNCNHTTRKFETKEELVREYNRVANAVKESEEKK